MKILSSLRSRIFLASALLAVLCIIAALYVVNVRVTQEAERTLEREIVATGAQIDQLRAERSQTFTLMARLIADLPKLKAAIDTNRSRSTARPQPPHRQRLPVAAARERAAGDEPPGTGALFGRRLAEGCGHRGQ